METLLYFGKVNICWILFYACYWLLFRKHTFFKWNRFYLVATLLVSFILPILSLPETQAPVLNRISYEITPISIPVEVMPVQEENSFPWITILVIAYSIGVIYMLYQLLQGLNSLRKLIKSQTPQQLERYTLIVLPKGFPTTGSFSFFKWLAVSDDDYNNHLDTIIQHESVHIQQYHSIDILLIEVLKVFFWSNPSLWFYKKSLQEIHEYLADEQAVNRDRYSHFLVSYTLQSPALTNHFFNRSLLKSRIKMMYKNRSSHWLLGKYLIIIPVLIIAVSLTAARKHLDLPKLSANVVTIKPNLVAPKPQPSFKEPEEAEVMIVKKTANTQSDINIKGVIVNQKGLPVRNASIVIKNSHKGTSSGSNGKFELKDVPANSQVVVSHVSYKSTQFDIDPSMKDYSIQLSPEQNILDEVVVVGYGVRAKSEEEKKQPNGFQVIEQKAEFPGGQYELMRYLARNIKYPSAASKVNMTGSVFVSFTINEEGTVSKPTVIKGLGFGLDDEALRVVSGMPLWKPAMQNGQAVESEYTVPIKFRLE